MSDRTEALADLSAARSRVALILTAAMVVIYIGFIVLIAYDKPLAASLAGGIPGLSVGILLGVLVILAAWLLTFIYVRWANLNYDEAMERLGK